MFSSKKDTTRTSKLFSGVSAAAMLLGISAGTARAAETTITNTVTSVSVTAASSLDFIVIDGGTVTNDITNNGTVGLPNVAKAIDVQFDGNVGGQILNATGGVVQASATGIFVVKGSGFPQPAPGGVNNFGSIAVLDSISAASGNARAKGVSQIESFKTGGVGITGPVVFGNNGALDIDSLVTGINGFAGGFGALQVVFFSTVSTSQTYVQSALNNNTFNVNASAVGSGGRAFGTAIRQQVSFSLGVSSVGGVNSLTTNNGTFDVFVGVIGAGGEIRSQGIWQLVNEGFTAADTLGDVTQTIINGGIVNISVLGNGNSLQATNIDGFDQDIVLEGGSTVGNIVGLVDNSGQINLTGQFNGNSINATFQGVEVFYNFETGSVGGNVNSTFNNSGTFRLDLNATGTNGSFRLTGVEQFILPETGSVVGDIVFSAVNSGTIDLDLGVIGDGNFAFADGIEQVLIEVSGSTVGQVSFSIDNSSPLSINALVQVTGANSTARAIGAAQFINAINTSSTAGDIDFNINNSGTVDVDSLQKGDNSLARATGLFQDVGFSNPASVGDVDFSIANSGDVDVLAQGAATGTGTQNIAASAVGFRQSGMATASGSLNFSASNATTGSLNVTASAKAVGTSSAIAARATATATGVRQVNNSTGNNPANYSFTNTGALKVSANVQASGGLTSNTATANAMGFNADVLLITSLTVPGAPNKALNLNINNQGSLNVNAVANATNAAANATGFRFNGATLSGSVTNGGTVSVTASAPGGSANAIGFSFNSERNIANFNNSGTINVLALGNTTSTAVKVGTSGFVLTSVVPGTTDAFTFTNNGGSINAQVNSGGTLGFGNAINTVDAPNPVIINLEGGGDIFGNILISDDDDIFVQNGLTFFDGMINGTTTLVGDLSVRSSGTFSLQVGVVSTEANIYVDTYTQTSTGTLSFTITPQTTILGQINAVEANLAGTVNLNITPGLYKNVTNFTKVINASTLNGTWDNVTTNTNSAFLSLTAQYPGDGTADLVLTRNAFNSLGGLTVNQNAAATGIENSYNVNLTGPYGTLVQDLLFMDAATFTAAVEQLHGAEHAQNLRSLLWSFDSLNGAISDRVNIGPYGTRGRHGTDVIHRGDFGFWARGSLGWGDNEGDVEAPGFDQDINAYHAGIDYAVSNSTIFGFAAGYYKNDLDFDNGNFARNDGYQFGVYAYHDIGAWYLRGSFGYGTYDAETTRSISVGTTMGPALGMYDVKAYSLQAEFGHRIEISPGTFITPFAAFDYNDVSLDAFTETGAGGANLVFPDNSISAFSADLGARFSAALDIGNGGLLIPEFSVAYRHDFSDERIMLNTGFSAANSGFQVISSHVDSGSILVNAGLTLATTGFFEIRGEYDGRFNSDYKESRVSIRLTLQFGQ